MGDLVGQADGQQHVAGIQGAAGAGGAGGTGDALGVQQHQQGLALDEAEAHVHVARQAGGGMAVQAAVGDLLQDALDHVIADGAELRVVRVDVRGGDLDGLADAHDGGQVLGAGAAVALLCAAVHELLQAHALADVQHADALGRMELVAGHAQHVDLHGLYVDLHAADGLHRVGVEEHAVLLADRGQLGDGLDGADLVVGGHDGHQRGVRADGCVQLLGGHKAVLVHRQVGHLEALLLQLRAGVQDGVVLDGGCDDVAALLQVLIGRAAHRPVVGLGAAAGEVDLVHVGVDGLGHLLACRVDRVARDIAKVVR